MWEHEEKKVEFRDGISFDGEIDPDDKRYVEMALDTNDKVLITGDKPLREDINNSEELKGKNLTAWSIKEAKSALST